MAPHGGAPRISHRQRKVKSRQQAKSRSKASDKSVRPTRAVALANCVEGLRLISFAADGEKISNSYFSCGGRGAQSRNAGECSTASFGEFVRSGRGVTAGDCASSG